MKRFRLLSTEINAFRTFDGYRMPEALEVHTHSAALGLLEDLPHLGLAIVGTRHPQTRSLELLEKTIEGLKGTRLIIISGFARGIDARAHELAAQFGLRTLAILGCGIEVDYPKENRRLRDQILDSGGMILSPFEKNAPPVGRNFYERNGLIAGFSKAVWVVEAAAVSGTLNTANWAMKFNRTLYATSCFPGDPFYQGNEKLLSQKNPDRYPVADPFFGIESLSPTWSDLSNPTLQKDFNFTPHDLSEVQKWALELKHRFGQCQVQALLKHAYQNGQTPGSFYLKLESELAQGLLRQEADGRIEVIY